MRIARAVAGPARQQSPHTELGFDDLRQEAIASVSLVVTVAGAAAAWLTLPGIDFQPGRWLAFLALCAGAIPVYLLCRRSPVLAQTLLLIAPIVSLALAWPATLRCDVQQIYKSSRLLFDLTLPDGKGLQVLQALPAQEEGGTPRVFVVTSGDDMGQFGLLCS